MRDKLRKLEQLVDRQMVLLQSVPEPELDRERSDGIKAAVGREAVGLRGLLFTFATPRIRSGVAAAALILAIGRSWQFRSGDTSASIGDPILLLSDWDAALDSSAAATAALVSEPWLPDVWMSASEAASELDALLDGFDRAFEIGA